MSRDHHDPGSQLTYFEHNRYSPYPAYATRNRLNTFLDLPTPSTHLYTRRKMVTLAGFTYAAALEDTRV